MNSLNIMNSLSDFLNLLGTMVTALVAVGSLVWFISGQFTKIRNLLHDQIKATQSILLEKIEYHERHDDQRFAAITNDLWTIRLQNAARYGLRPEIPTNDQEVEEPLKSGPGRTTSTRRK